jgi:YD repeat-containing protein
MKKSIFLLLLFGNLLGFAQKVDWLNAPMNPIAFEYKKEHFNLKGDVYAYGRRVFSEEGNLIYEKTSSNGVHYLYKNGLLFANSEGRLYEFNSQGYLTKLTYASLGIQTINYTYNAKGLLIKEVGSKGLNSSYEYDSFGRLIKSNVSGGIRQFSYQKNGDQLIITEINSVYNPAKTIKHIYKNGIRIGENDKIFTKEFDKFGNETSWYQSALFYSDLKNKEIEISLVYKKSSLGRSMFPLNDCEFFINDKKVDFLYTELDLQQKNLLLYNPFKEKYYIVENPIDDAKSGKKQLVSKLFINSPYLLKNTKGSSYKLGYKGATLENTVNGMRDGALKAYNAPIYLLYDKTINQTFVGELDSNNTTGYYPLHPIAIDENVVYIKTGETQFVVIIEGKIDVKENPNHKLIALQNGNSIIKDENDKIIYYLPNTSAALLNKAYAGKKYNPATDKIESHETNPSIKNTNTNTISNNPIKESACLSGDCINTFSKKRFANGEILEGFFENGKINGVGTHTLPNGNYYIGNFKDDYYDGYGIYSWKSEEMIYYGNWQKGLQNGYGYQLKNSKAVVAGYYTNGKLTRDMLTYDYTNNIYKNNCAGDCANGFGQYKYSDKSWYYGFFQNNKPHYVGMYKNNEGDLYMGQFIANKMEGVGTLLYKSDGQSYVGQFSNSNFNGKGYKADKNFVITQKGNWVNGFLTNNNFTIEKPKPVNTTNKSLSAEAKAYFDVYNSNPNSLKQHLANLDKKWKAKAITGDVLGQNYASLINEIYQVAPEAAFEFMMKMEKDATKDTLPKLETEVRDYVREKSKERLQKYTKSN